MLTKPLIVGFQYEADVHCCRCAGERFPRTLDEDYETAYQDFQDAHGRGNPEMFQRAMENIAEDGEGNPVHPLYFDPDNALAWEVPFGRDRNEFCGSCRAVIVGPDHYLEGEMFSLKRDVIAKHCFVCGVKTDCYLESLQYYLCVECRQEPDREVVDTGGKMLARVTIGRYDMGELTDPTIYD